MSNFFDIWIIGTYSAIHKTAGRQQERPRRLFPYSRLQGFSGIVPGEAGNGEAGNGEAGGFVKSAVRGPANSRLHSRLMGVSGIVPVKIMEQLGTMRPAAL